MAVFVVEFCSTCSLHISSHNSNSETEKNICFTDQAVGFPRICDSRQATTDYLSTTELGSPGLHCCMSLSTLSLAEALRIRAAELGGGSDIHGFRTNSLAALEQSVWWWTFY